MMEEADPTPCSRTGFHISTSSLYFPAGTIIMSPGDAASIHAWIVPPQSPSTFGCFPPIVTVTLSTDCLPFPAVMTNWPHSVGVAPGAYCGCCWMLQAGTLAGAVTTICVSLQLVIGAAT